MSGHFSELVVVLGVEPLDVRVSLLAWAEDPAVVYHSLLACNDCGWSLGVLIIVQPAIHVSRGCRKSTIRLLVKVVELCTLLRFRTQHQHLGVPSARVLTTGWHLTCRPILGCVRIDVLDVAQL